METSLSYLINPTVFKQNATVVGKGTDEKGRFVLTDVTPAYPQGGGQESDRGVFIARIGEFNFNDVKYQDGIVKHYLVDGWAQLNEGDPVEIVIDENRRKRNCILHTAGHLIASVAFQMIPGLIPIKGHHFSDGSYIELSGQNQMNLEELKPRFQSVLNLEIKSEKVISYDMVTAEELKIRCPFVQPGVPTHKPLRVVTIESFFPMGCGGTHIQKLNEIPLLTVTKLKFTKGTLRIGYRCF